MRAYTRYTLWLNLIVLCIHLPVPALVVCTPLQLPQCPSHLCLLFPIHHSTEFPLYPPSCAVLQRDECPQVDSFHQLRGEDKRSIRDTGETVGHCLPVLHLTPTSSSWLLCLVPVPVSQSVTLYSTPEHLIQSKCIGPFPCP